MPQLATALCTVFFVYGVQCLALNEVDSLKSQLSSAITSVVQQVSVLNSTYFKISIAFRDEFENITATANEVMLSYENKLLALAEAFPGVDITPCKLSNSAIIADLQEFQTESIMCIGNLPNDAFYQFYDTTLNDNLRYQTTLDGLLSGLDTCGNLTDLDPCGLAVHTEFTALTSDPDYIAALAPNLASDISAAIQTDISNCVDTPSLLKAIALSNEYIAFAVNCVAALLLI